MSVYHINIFNYLMFVKFHIRKLTLLKRNKSFFRKKNNTNTQLILHPGYAQFANSDKISFKDIELDENLTFIKLDRNGKKN